MATASGAIAEVYIAKRTYQEKMKKMEKEGASAGGQREADHDQAASKNTSTGNNKHKGKKSSSGGFFASRRIFKKVHSSTADVPSSETTHVQ